MCIAVHQWKQVLLTDINSVANLMATSKILRSAFDIIFKQIFYSAEILLPLLC